MKNNSQFSIVEKQSTMSPFFKYLGVNSHRIVNLKKSKTKENHQGKK